MWFMDFEYVAFPRSAADIFCKRTPFRRIYKKQGGADEYRAWVDALAEHVGPVLSTGEAAVYVGVTRAAVWKRMNSGHLTAFCFSLQVSDGKKAKRLSDMDVCMVLSELRQWRDFRVARKAEIERMEQEEKESDQNFKGIEAWKKEEMLKEKQDRLEADEMGIEDERIAYEERMKEKSKQKALAKDT